MKTIRIVLFLSLFCAQLSVAQNHLFDKYADMDSVTSVYISKGMFQMIPKVKDIGLDLMNLTGKIESLQILSTQQKELSEQMRKEFSQLINHEYEELMRIKDGHTRATFYVDKKGDLIKELLMLANVEGGFTIIRLLGNFTLQDIQNMTTDLDKL
ncbi:MAG: DUF4252 domain-containing protein [Tannerellaceae bacterium]|jgi:hypothetical protein|nr:DUF4252 domain-containing protein [Tannerellaceae bacterium]